MCHRINDHEGRPLYTRGKVAHNCICFDCFEADGCYAPGRTLKNTKPGRFPEGSREAYLARPVKYKKTKRRR